VTSYDLTLRIEYNFSPPAGAGRQHLRILPAVLPLQQELRSCRLSISPEPVDRRDFVDFFGTRVIEIALPAGLTQFSLILQAEVERRLAMPGLDVSAACEVLADEMAAHSGLDAASPHHFLAPSPRIAGDDSIAAFARHATRGAATAHQAVLALGEALHQAMVFDALATEVDTPPERAFALRSGVCQDFAQIMIGGLRSLGIPAAYVSGYLRTLPPPGQMRLIGADAMHAWVQAWTGLDGGWVEYDPTNGCLAGDGHIRIGFGRDYGDVPPVAGMLRLGGGQTGSHSVDLVELVRPR
jgi:transglutaminase-like putative cysteine protease